MKKSDIVNGVATQVVWWIGERRKKLVELRHETMAINPFLLPLIFGTHSFNNFDELAEFLVAAHLATGYATGFGKLMDEKILPRVFKTTKLDKAARKDSPLSLSVFDEIDHLVVKDASTRLLSLKAGRWTIQLTMAVQLNKAFSELLRLKQKKALGKFDFDEIAVGVFYGTKQALTDKYDILRGVNRGAVHDVQDLTKDVHVYAGREFWAWLNDDESQTQEWVLEGILQGFAQAEKSTEPLSSLLASFRKEFSQQFQSFVRKDLSIDWKGIIRKING
jgi:hypothetical protein